jgi:hypothetical protein
MTGNTSLVSRRQHAPRGETPAGTGQPHAEREDYGGIDAAYIVAAVA